MKVDDDSMPQTETPLWRPWCCLHPLSPSAFTSTNTSGCRGIESQGITSESNQIEQIPVLSCGICMSWGRWVGSDMCKLFCWDVMLENFSLYIFPKNFNLVMAFVITELLVNKNPIQCNPRIPYFIGNYRPGSSLQTNDLVVFLLGNFFWQHGNSLTTYVTGSMVNDHWSLSYNLRDILASVAIIFSFCFSANVTSHENIFQLVSKYFINFNFVVNYDPRPEEWKVKILFRGSFY